MNVKCILFCSGKICSEHFERSCYNKSAQQIALNYSPVRGRKLKFDAISTLNLFVEPHIEEPVSICTKVTSEVVSVNIANKRSSTSTAKFKPVALESIGDVMTTSATSIDYPTIV